MYKNTNFFAAIEVLFGCKVRPISLRTGTKAPVLKIENGVIHELVINFIVLYVSSCIRILILTGIEVLIDCQVSLISLRTGNEPPVLKIAFMGHFTAWVCFASFSTAQTT